MAKIEKISVALPEPMVAEVRGVVEAGEYASASEVIREALREWSHRRADRQAGIDRLRRLWEEAVNSPDADESPEEIMGRLERKYQAMADEAEARRVCA